MQRHLLGTILVVEDDENEVKIYELAFKRADYPVPLQHVHNSEEAIRYLRGENDFADRKQFPFPRYIISDLKMPGGTGFDLLRALRQNDDWSIIPTVILSGSGDADDVKKCLLLGATGYFVKRHALCETTHLMKIIFEYMQLAEHPARDNSGHLLPTSSRGKLGENF